MQRRQKITRIQEYAQYDLPTIGMPGLSFKVIGCIGRRQVKIAPHFMESVESCGWIAKAPGVSPGTIEIENEAPGGATEYFKNILLRMYSTDRVRGGRHRYPVC